MSSILKGLTENYSRDEENQQNAMDTRRNSDLSRERNAGLDEPDELPTTSVETRNGVYEYNVPADQEDIAQELGLQQHRGHWVSRIPIQRANFQFGRPQFHEIPAKGVAEGKEDKIAQLKKDHATAVHWSKNETSPQKREAARQRAEKIKGHLEKQYKQGVAEGSKEQEYGPEWDEKVKRLGQMAKQGERKTVWDPVKRVYKTVPVQQSSIKEGLDELDENLNKWFKEKWVRFGPDGKIRGDCARGDDSEGKPKCLPQSKAQNLGKKGRASAAARKRREDPNPERSGKAINVNTKKKSNEGVAEGSIEQRIAQAKKNNPLRASVAKKTNGYAALVTDTTTGKPSWFGGALWQTPELAMGHAKAFVKGFPYLEQEYAQRFIDKNRNGIVGQGVTEEQLDELSCWTGYTRVQGVPAGAPGSCKKKTNEEEHNEKCPECGGPMFSDLLLAEKQDACYNKVKSRYKVWPSAYASGALVQCRKKGAANWGNGSKKNESIEEDANTATVDQVVNLLTKLNPEEKKQLADELRQELNR